MKRILNMLSIIMMIVVGYQEVVAQAASKPVIGPKELKLESDRITPEVLWAMGRLGEVVVSPDGKNLALTITYYDVEENKGNSELYVMNMDGSDLKRLTFTTWGEYNPRWTPDGKKIAFMSAESGAMQMWEMKPDGSEKVQISNIDGGIGGFAYAPDQKKVLYLADVEKTSLVQSRYPDLTKTTGRINNDLMYRHWDQWVDAFTHIWIADYDGKQLSNGKDIMAGEEWESPVRPFGGMEQISWSTDSKSVVYTSRKKKGKEYSLSTNTDLYQYDLAKGVTVNLTEGMMGYDMNPVFSPDGQKIAWESMERDGYEADKIRLFVMDLKTGNKTYLTENFDQNVQGLNWSADGKKIYFISNWHALDQMYSIELASGKINKITEGVHDFTSVMVAGKYLIGGRMSMSAPSELFRVDEQTGKQEQITSINSELLKQLSFGKVEERWIPTTDGKQMLDGIVGHRQRLEREPVPHCELGRELVRYQ